MQEDLGEFTFQFPVGMSNRSYWERAILREDIDIIIFQFPVGMSNRSYWFGKESL